ncbi:peptidylprolyl isomerase [Sphingomonas koreensis]|jgi:peptidyl-prolyl cis-trans isomerase SurA|uniref:Parvulin-like PPIase n=2 Tax=Sphingomonas koreensis TaxID=93064 RepID=A0A2M8W9P3_9SPHN|nr:peptidylprolyl isomerase [Sphingomonas koreensis]MDC7811117.1 peptidylprolyl isomerase [Sphingomonas koreensis]PJI87634.1 peptidyl-prolyl cis-trans isomerase SurA [Sphingomonas koreensis]RSU19295.1 peptidylprolyl isomerase [Sphingomonas koreensis]RSU28383.1 peptidylprolyl isomerase [Sphingomonas koreensis]RSU31297.1 peptidylprolyl isomerase [Sphingomonas koreensis]
MTMTLKVGHFCRSAALILGIAGSAAIAAQTAGDTPPSSAANLDLPKELQLFSKPDPNVRKPTALVNGYVITRTDVDQRFALFVALNQLKLTAEEQDRLRLQVLRLLTDETIQIQEAKSNDITIPQDQIDRSFASIANRYQRTPDQMRAWLREIGSSERSFKRQIEGEIAWQRVIQRKIGSLINVGDEEVKSIIERLEQAKGTDEFQLREIYISATPERQGEVFQAMQQMIQQMQQGRPFEYFAQFSEATTRSVGGDLGWVRSGMLPAQLGQAAQQMQVGQVAGPIEVPGGFSILYLVDKRQVLTSDPRDARLSLRQLTVKFPAGTTQAQAQTKASEFATVLKSTAGCGAVGKAAETLGAEVVDNDSVRARDLPPQLQDIILKLQIGESTPPFGSPEEGVRALVLCGRDDPKTAALPNPDQIREQIEETRTNLRAQRYLRDLRRDAIIDYR